jgi:hypothetical protein
MKSFAVFLLTVLASVALFVQATPQAALSPFPVWPADGNVPDNLRDHYLFLGPKVGQVTISYPASLDDPRLTGRKTFVLDLHNQVEPIFSVQISAGNGIYNYDYVLRNGKSAKQVIKTWFFPGPANDPAFQVQGPGWTGSKALTVKPRQLTLPNAAQAAVNDLQPEVIVTFFSNPGYEITPNNEQAFHISSSYLPGFTTASVSSGVAFALPGELPTPVGDQVGVLTRLGWDSKQTLALGPKFTANWSKQAIAADFHYGISSLTRSGNLSGDSPFVKQALATLAMAIQSGNTSALANQFSSLPKPSPGLENEIAAAMQLSLKQ